MRILVTIIGSAIYFSMFAQIDKEEYFRNSILKLNTRAFNGDNITEDAIKLITDSTFVLKDPVTGIYFNQGYALTLALLPINPDNYTNQLIDFFNSTLSVPTRMGILYLLWHSNGCEGNKFLKKTSKNLQIERKISQYAYTLVKWKYKSNFFIYDPLKKNQKEEIREFQLNCIKGGDFSKTTDLDYYTRRLRKEKCY